MSWNPSITITITNTNNININMIMTMTMTMIMTMITLDEKTSKEVSLSPLFARSRDTKARIDSPVVVLTFIGGTLSY